jgi:hypothetical protein
VADLGVCQFEQAGLEELFFDGGAQDVFDEAVVCLCAGQQEQGEVLFLAGCELASAKWWGLHDIARQAVLK